LDEKILAMNNPLLRCPAIELLELLSQVSAQWQTSNKTTHSRIQTLFEGSTRLQKSIKSNLRMVPNHLHSPPQDSTSLAALQQ